MSKSRWPRIKWYTRRLGALERRGSKLIGQKRFLPRALGDGLHFFHRPSEITDVLRRFIHSLWPGYLSRGNDDFRAWCADNGIDFVIRHCSGHADSTTLRRLADALAPRRIVPIHTEAADRFPGTFASHVIDAHRNGEWWDV